MAKDEDEEEDEIDISLKQQNIILVEMKRNDIVLRFTVAVSSVDKDEGCFFKCVFRLRRSIYKRKCFFPKQTKIQF